ncbi:GntR family transcriptional regulator [Actinoplanes sp. TBRC 11911]|uniref:GntR family transcriptional regulator n=1 Tax=Actinoplanes sp. TBRC 11911 TaxID=2729386 RepID=UPI00145EE4F7|nr:GntR family transcriptional regulator [Actinoplanes sp. TBRC 11911]NMO51662.1 GntR family transcriptional regulator [Actinoplanes sp. TBRC 11911]
MESVGRHLLRDAAYGRLRRAIIDGTLAPGTALKPDELAARLGLSRAPIREALFRLAGEGLVETKPQSYTRVTLVDAKEAADAVAVLEAMHDLAVREIAASIPAELVETMRQANRRFATAVAVGDADAALDADDELHAVPLEAYGNAAAVGTVVRYTPLVRRSERLLFTSARASGSVALHDELIDALAAHDRDRAVTANHTIWRRL